MADIIERKFYHLYDGEVEIEFLPKSHIYNLIKEGKVLPKKRRLTGASTIAGKLDKSRQLMPWATKMYTKKIQELMGESNNFTRADLESMLVLGEKAHTDFSDKAKSIGTYVHKFCEEYAVDQDAEKSYERMVKIEGEPAEDLVKKINVAVEGFVTWAKAEKIKFLEAEGLVYSRKEGFVGQYDAIIIHSEQKYLVDYKTSSGIYSEYYYQTSGYLKAKEEETGEKFDGVAIIAIAKEDKENKEGIIIKKAGDITVEFRSRGDLVKDYKAFKGLNAVNDREKELSKEWRAKNKK